MNETSGQDKAKQGKGTKAGEKTRADAAQHSAAKRDPGDLRDVSAKLLAADAWIDSTLWQAWQAIRAAWRGYSAFMRRFRARGLWRILAELGSEGATLGTAGVIVMLAFAQPAFEATKRADWKTTSDFSVTFFDRNGDLLGKRGILLNDKVPLDEIPDQMIKATLATEDRRFFSHFGIDFIGTFRALVANVKARSVVQGGSSLSQQLAKNLFLSNERTLQRKIKEAYLALWLEANLSKREILKLYLDRAYMGGGTFGVTAAADYYFDKDIREITLAEAAMLAGLYKAPSKYAPHENLPNARARANEVLSNMVEANFLSEGQIIAARRNPATPVDRGKSTAADYFMDYAFEQIQDLALQFPELSKDRVLSVDTTLDSALQSQAESSVASMLDEQGKRYRVREGALASITTSGEVRAMVGGRDYDESQFNRAVHALRQPGSSFKPFVYMTAFLNGYSAEDIIRDAPINIGGWSPRNYGRRYRGAVTLKTALTKSINTVPVRLAQKVGRDKIVQTAYMMGIQSELRISRPLPLGVAEVTVIDMAGSYAAFASGGLKVQPFAVVKVRNSKGELVYDHARDAAAPIRILPFDKTAEMNDILVNVVQAGTGRRARIEGVTAAGKTGTTQAYRDAWFVGYTGNLVTAVWYGNDDFTPTNNMTGGSLPAMTWQKYMEFAHQGVEIQPMPGIDPEAYSRALIAQEGDAAPARQLPQILRNNTRQELQALHERFGQILGRPQAALSPALPFKKAQPAHDTKHDKSDRIHANYAEDQDGNLRANIEANGGAGG
ncbi:transglycosylase domain-containing protein [Polycladidibacter hongkongensis]|uniref:transglycosylase domain-containing protein n=1 Tax=Polycladidibacter hongkongensis TaxID=1647556 RepID=UPI000B066E58|nr:PBP1A family penicillin-binding protein [Pseudovibrio hongkongensis]